MARTRHWSVLAPLWLLGLAVATAASVAILSPIAPAEAAQRGPNTPGYTLLANGVIMAASAATEPPTAAPQAAYSPGAPIGPQLLRFGLPGGLAVVVVGALVASTHRKPSGGYSRVSPARAEPSLPVGTADTEPAHTRDRMAPASLSTREPSWPRRPSVSTAARAAPGISDRAEASGSSERGAAWDALVACARAVEAARRYDRNTTRRNFALALRSNAEVNPGGVNGFWDMPSSGHADLARAYLDLDRRLDARTVLTVALITFRHNRELEALLRESRATDGRDA